MKNLSSLIRRSLSFLIILTLIPGLTSMMETKKQDKRSSGPVHAQTIQPSYHQGMITFKIKEGAGQFIMQKGKVSFQIPSLDMLSDKFELRLLEQRFKFNPQKRKEGMPDLSRIYRIGFPETYSVVEVARAFENNPLIEYAEPMPVNTFLELPDDELLEQCQHLPQIMAPEAWEIHHGEDGEEVVVAIVDTGTDWLHPDLVENTWQNLGEDADGDGVTLEYDGNVWVRDPDDLNGIDDDGNGYVDDVIGWDFHEALWNDDGSNPDPLWNQGPWWHGTHCTGIAAGRTNNEIGISSVSWNIKYMPVQTDNGANTVLYGYDGIIYAAENGADIISNSWGLSYSQSDAEAVAYAQQLGSIIVAAAGNSGELAESYPASYPGVISVASVNVDDTKTAYSTFSPAVDISAPGGGWEGGILSTMPSNGYGLASGTSMASPMVAGCLGLLKSYHPDWNNEQLITQLLGTADEINSINPDFQYLLGSGRVNAYHMLVEENVTMPQEFKITMTNNVPVDENGNNINEAGELVTLNFEFWNFIPYLSEDNVTVSLQSSDPEIEILDGTANVNIPPDGPFAIEDQFQVKVSEDAHSHMVVFTLHFQTTIPVVYGQDMEYQLLVAPSGIFVFEGKNNERDFSGTFIRSFLEKLGYEVTYSNVYPYSLRGFETVFTSHGNYGADWTYAYPIMEEHAILFQDFLEEGGNMYVEMDRMFTRSYYQGFANYAQLKQLFGVSTHVSPNVQNPVDSLYGMESTPFEGITFNRSRQLNNWRMEIISPLAGAITPFAEYGYGKISIMNDGATTYGQKTFYLTYALGELVDNSVTNSRYNVLFKIMDHFGHPFPEGYVLSNFAADKTIGSLPLEVHFTDISISDTGYQVNSWAWDFDSDGIIDSYDQNPDHTYSTVGLHDVTLIVSNGTNTDTLVMEDYITINHGFLVYEGVPGGPCYSGSFISDYLSENAYTHTYTTEFPESLEGYAAVFLSLGNYGINYTQLTSLMASEIVQYLENGGYLYIEGGDALGYDQASNTTLLNLLGVASTGDGTTNMIDSLMGQPEALTSDLLFTSSSQQAVVYIDTFNPLDEAKPAFVESDYGTVAVQYTGEHDQRTFCFSYALADLDDDEFPSTREELLHRICNYFGIYTDVNPAFDGQLSTLGVYPNPCGSMTTVSYSLNEKSIASISIYTHNGQHVKTVLKKGLSKGTYSTQIDLDGLPAGLYLCVLQTDEGISARKIIKLD